MGTSKNGLMVRMTAFREEMLNRRLASGLLLGAGVVLCLLAASGLSAKLCLNEGCQVYRGYKLWGFSLHHVGGAAFALGLFWLYQRSPVYADFIRLCLWGETALLAFQAVYLPCSECLLVGFLWGLVGLLTIPRELVVKLWAVLFLAAVAMMAKELIKPWPVYGGQDAAVKVFFSPSCPHCRETIDNLMAGGIQGEDVAFYPVALEDKDCQRVAQFQQTFGASLNLWRALQACWEDPKPCALGFWEWLRLRLGLMRNQLVLARMGVRQVPLVLSNAVAWGGTGGGCSAGETPANCGQ